MKAVVIFAFVAAAVAVPQFGLPKLPAPAPPAAIPGVAEGLEWTKKIQDLVNLVRVTLTDMGEIAVQDNPEVGAKIVAKLQTQIAKAAQILTEFTAKSARIRRDVSSNGSEAYNSVGDVLVESNDKTQPEKSQLSPEAQQKMDDRFEKGLKDCEAQSCKAHAEKYAKAKAAKAKKNKN